MRPPAGRLTADDLRHGYAGRSCLVTGADGFIGSHLVEALVALGAETHAFVRATSSGELRNLGAVADRVRLHRGNVLDPVSVRSALRALQGGSEPIIFHLAAQAHVGESWQRPHETLETNVLGTLNLLQGVVDTSLTLHSFDTAGTSEEYGNAAEPPPTERGATSSGRLVLHERSPLNPKSVYATAKVAADFLTMNYFDAYGIPTLTTRMFNNYGPRQSPRFVTGAVIGQALLRADVHLGALHPRRDFCHVRDGVRGHLHVALAGHPGEVYAYGQGRNISIGEWAELILRVGRDAGLIPAGRRILLDETRLRPGCSEVDELLVGYDKLQALTGWQPELSWEDGLLDTIRWHAAHRAAWRGRTDWR